MGQASSVDGPHRQLRASGQAPGEGDAVVRPVGGLVPRLVLREGMQAGLPVPDVLAAAEGGMTVAAQSVPATGSGSCGSPLVFGMTAVCSRCGEVYWVVFGHACSRRRSR